MLNTKIDMTASVIADRAITELIMSYHAGLCLWGRTVEGVTKYFRFAGKQYK